MGGTNLHLGTYKTVFEGWPCVRLRSRALNFIAVPYSLHKYVTWSVVWYLGYWLFFCFASFLVVCLPVNKQCASVMCRVTGLKRGATPQHSHRAVVHSVTVVPDTSLPLTGLGIPESMHRTRSDCHMPRNTIIGLPVHREVEIHVCSGQAEIADNRNEPSRLLQVPQVLPLCPTLKSSTKSLPGRSE